MPILAYDANVLHERGNHAIASDGMPCPISDSLVFGVEVEVESIRGDHGSSGDICDCGNSECLDSSAEGETSGIYTECEEFENNTNFNSFGIIKSDGSLNCGMELVTLPATLQAHAEHLNWETWCAALRNDFYGNGRSTGIHVHINKAALTNLTLGKMLVFINNPKHRNFISAVAQRDISDISDWCKTKTKVLADGGVLSDDRYQAVNVSHDTAEIRIFNGNLLSERILKNIEFCHALVILCRRRMASSITVANFLKHVARETKLYPNLSQFIKDRNICA